MALKIGVWHSLVVRLVRDQEAVGSNPVTPTKKKREGLEHHSKGQFSEIRYISKEVCRIFVFVDTNAVLVKKNDVVKFTLFFKK